MWPTAFVVAVGGVSRGAVMKGEIEINREESRLIPINREEFGRNWESGGIGVDGETGLD